MFLMNYSAPDCSASTFYAGQVSATLPTCIRFTVGVPAVIMYQCTGRYNVPIVIVFLFYLFIRTFGMEETGRCDCVSDCGDFKVMNVIVTSNIGHVVIYDLVFATTKIVYLLCVMLLV